MLGTHARDGFEAGRRPRRLAGILCGALLGLYAVFGFFVATNIHHRLDPTGAPLGYDFSVFYEAGRFALSGHAADAYSDDAMVAAERAAFPGSTTQLPWNYPPTFQLLLLPLAALPYLTAWLLWSVLLYGLYAIVVRSFLPGGGRWLLLLFPGAAVNLLMGQNGLLTTTLIGGGTLLLGRRPVLGGMLLGLMAYKPHFAILIPLALLCGREWRALAGAAFSGLGLIAASAALFGVQPWLGFVAKAMQVTSLYEAGSSDWHTIPSILVMMRSLGFANPAGAVAHWSVAAIAATGAAWVWRKNTDSRLRAAALAAGTLILSPYLRIYDLALLALPIGAVLFHGGTILKAGERLILAAAWFLPAILLFAHPRIQVGAVVVCLAMGLVLRAAGARERSERYLAFP